MSTMECVPSASSSASFEDGLGRLGFSDLSEQHLSIRAVYKGSSIFLLALGRAYVIKCPFRDGTPV